MAKIAVTSSPSLYETDFHAWTQEQAALLRRGRVSMTDLTHIAEEIAALGRKEISELRSRYTVLVQHLLKERFQPEKATRSWATTILLQRLAIARHMDDNPSLKAKADTLFKEAYVDARKLAASETGIALEVFPVSPPFTREQALRESEPGD